jgi:hypothetical protein
MGAEAAFPHPLPAWETRLMTRFVLLLLALVACALLLTAPAPARAADRGFVMDIFVATPGPDDYWTLCGHLDGLPPGTQIWVEFGGVITGEVTIDQFGCFWYTVQVPAGTMGTVSATGYASNGILTTFTNTCYDTID